MTPLFILTLVIVFIGAIIGILIAIKSKQKPMKLIGAGISIANVVLFATLIKFVLIG